jgi:hypothetical protein
MNKYKKYTKEQVENFLEENFIEGFDNLYDFIKNQKVVLEIKSKLLDIVKDKEEAELIIKIKLHCD